MLPPLDLVLRLALHLAVVHTQSRRTQLRLFHHSCCAVAVVSLDSLEVVTKMEFRALLYWFLGEGLRTFPSDRKVECI